MAGYIFTLSDKQALFDAAKTGAFGPYLRPPDAGTRWRESQEGTFADFATMKSGDNVYFFFKRNIYGIGELVPVEGAVRHLNFEDASEPMSFDYDEARETMLLDLGEDSVAQRWICTFKPSPSFFGAGVDMDDVLSSAPGAFRMLRAMLGVSFMKVDDEENQALRNILLRRNLDATLSPKAVVGVLSSSWQKSHLNISKKRTETHDFRVRPLLEACASEDGIRHEMALEAGILWQLASGDSKTSQVFGSWDYLSHQVMASPFKPLVWADKIDIFGYAWLGGFRPTIGRYLVCEVKRGSASSLDVDQVMKYVDWVKDEYASGDYGTIQAFLVAYDFGQGTVEHANEVARRIYTLGRRPALTKEWDNLALLRYRWNKTTKRLRFTRADP